MGYSNVGYRGGGKFCTGKILSGKMFSGKYFEPGLKKAENFLNPLPEKARLKGKNLHSGAKRRRKMELCVEEIDFSLKSAGKILNPALKTGK